MWDKSIIHKDNHRRQTRGNSIRIADKKTSGIGCIYCGKIFSQTQIDRAIKLGDLSRKIRNAHIHPDCGNKKLTKGGIKIPESLEQFTQLIRDTYLREISQKHKETMKKIEALCKV